MNETTRAILRKELEERRAARDRYREMRAAMEGALTKADHVIGDMSVSIDDIEAVLATDAAGLPIGLKRVGDIDLTHGETLHIHNG